jgi:hypothetical protein
VKKCILKKWIPRVTVKESFSLREVPTIIPGDEIEAPCTDPAVLRSP